MTNDLERRLTEHKRGKTWSTKRLGGEVELIGYFVLETKEDAANLERQIKKSKNTKRWIGHDDFILGD